MGHPAVGAGRDPKRQALFPIWDLSRNHRPEGGPFKPGFGLSGVQLQLGLFITTGAQEICGVLCAAHAQAQVCHKNREADGWLRRPSLTEHRQKRRLKGQLQRHLNLPRAPDRMGHIAQSARAVIEAVVGLATAGGTSGGSSGRAYIWKLVVILVLKHFVSRDVEAGSVGEVVNIKGVLEVDPLFDIGHLDQRNVCPLLPRLAENITLTGRKVRFKCIAGRDSREFRAGRGDHRNIEARRVERRRCVDAEGSGVAGLRLLGQHSSEARWGW